MKYSIKKAGMFFIKLLGLVTVILLLGAIYWNFDMWAYQNKCDKYWKGKGFEFGYSLKTNRLKQSLSFLRPNHHMVWYKSSKSGANVIIVSTVSGAKNSTSIGPEKFLIRRTFVDCKNKTHWDYYDPKIKGYWGDVRESRNKDADMYSPYVDVILLSFKKACEGL